MSELVQSSAAELARAVREGRASAAELTGQALARIAARSDLGAFLAVDGDGAMIQARDIDARIARGDDVGPLAGVPVALKDALVTRGLETTAASKMLAGWVPPYDATVVSKLRAAGAVIVGKTNMDEFAMGSSNENSAFGACRNPWDPSRVPGGSSGGSAAAVAARLCAASLGTDTGGSIRQPAALTGTVGLKPTYGRVSRYGVIAYASSFDQVGPITRTVADAALMLQVIAGFDPHDATSLDVPVPDYSRAVGDSVSGLRIGVPVEFMTGDIDAEVRAAFDAAVEALRGRGAVLREVSLPHTPYALPTYYLLAPAEASSNLARYDGVRFGHRAQGCEGVAEMYARSRGEGFGAEVKRRIMLGTFALRSGYYDAYYRKAQKVRALIARDFQLAFQDCDLIASPTSPFPAFALGERTRDPMQMYLADVFTLSCNLAGLPGLSVPCGLTAGNLPIGFQLMAPALQEERLLRAGSAIEADLGLGDCRPPEVQA